MSVPGTSPPPLLTPAVFTHGSIMRHVIVMTATGSIGLVSVFVVDFLSLLYVSRLGDPAALAGVGYATQVMFFITSLSIGLAIGVTALVSRAVGSGNPEIARRLAASCLLQVAACAAVVSVGFFAYRADLLRALGAQGEAFEIANQFLTITLPANALLALGMSLSGILRAHGDARRAMYVTLFGGIATAIFDPIFIFGLKLGAEGAAVSTVLGRLVFMATGLWGTSLVHRHIGRPRVSFAIQDAPLMAVIAGPAILTNLAAPLANAYAMRVFSQFGAATVAAFVIIDRVSPVAFGVLFALTGSVGPIIGQNFGAGLFGRIRRTLIDCFLLSAGYAFLVWAILWMAAPHIADVFAATGRTRDLVLFFCSYGVIVWIFLGCLFVSNAVFNNLGFPFLATLFNWGRATLGTIPFVTIGARMSGPEGGYIGIIGGAALFGLGAMATAFLLTTRLARKKVP